MEKGAVKHRRSIRLPDFDYALPGAYFITLVTQGRARLFGEIVNDEMALNAFGSVVEECWEDIHDHFAHVETGAFVVMPNHVHGIIHLYEDTGRGKACLAPTGGQFGKPAAGSLPTIVGSFKSAATKRINELRGTPGAPLWLRNYYEHILRSDREYLQVEKYVLENPLHWLSDDEHAG